MKSKRLIALVMAATISAGLVTTPSQITYAQNIQTVEVSEAEEILVFEEGFNGFPGSQPEGWTFASTEVYTSEGNYGKASPSIKLNKNGQTLVSPTFELDGEGKLSFYIKGNGSGGEFTSVLKIEELIGGSWSTIGNANANLSTNEVSVSKDATQIRFVLEKNIGNVAIDDIKLSYIEEEKIEGLVSIKEARESELQTEVVVKGIVTYKEASGSSFNYALQDGTAAIALRGVDGLSIGDEVVLKGKTSEFNGLMQINGFEIIEKRNKKDLPTAKVITLKDIVENNAGEIYESQRVIVNDLTVGAINLSGDTLLSDSEGNTINLYKAGELDDIKEGDKVNVSAILSQFSKNGNAGYQLRIAHPWQVKKVNESEVPGEPETPVDKEGPTVIKVTPGNSTNLGENRRPEISATFEDESGVDMDSIKVLFNGEDVTSEIQKEDNTIKYIVSEDLKDGKHTVKVEVADKLGNITTKEWRFTVGTVETELYFGQLHSHTNLSDGTGSIDDAYQYAQGTAGVDFVAVTDHSNWFDNDTSANLADGSASSEWQLGLSTADKYNTDGEFVAIYGYEMTWSGSTGGYGHINTFNTPGFETRTNKSMNLETYYETLKTQEQSLSQLNHPGKTFGDFSDFAHYDEEIDELVTLVEVGNGEGAIRSSGYFPSYEYYTRALDKGWHVAPTNNQDNHKGKWGNANTARTVVEATDLTRESIYEAIRERRTYATEDENLRISYKINGNTMGSIIDETDSLKFEISVEDIDNGDNIEKISIIGDGGKVVKSIDNINATSKTWEFTLDENVSSYYYVRVDQADKDIAVTAAIWVGEKENVGISTIDCDTELIVENEEFNITTTIYNNESQDLKDVSVEYYINGATEPVVVEIEKIASSATEAAKLTHKFEKAGEYQIDVVVKANVNGNDKEFTGSIELEVSRASEVSKVVIDGAHQNQYVSGDYAGKLNTLTGLMTQNGVKSVINYNPITDEVLEGASLLILSDPQSTKKDSYGLTPQKYSEEELAAIAKFANNGGNIVITSKADYGDGIGEYGNAAQGNSVLEAIGAKIRFNDDQATDDDNNGGQSYRLYFNTYNTESELLKDVDTTKNYSFYSGSTLIMPEDTENIEVLVRGHETTYGNDADGKGDNVPTEKGDVVALATEILPGGGKVVVSGATFFSDFEIDGYVYSNYDITGNVIKQLAPLPEIPVSKIADVRVDSDNDNNPDRFGEKVVVEGYVTAASNAASKGNSFFDVIYIQDETAGLTVFGVSSTEVKLGQKVRITGRVSSYLGDAQVALNNEMYDLEIIDESINLVAPTELTTNDSMLEEKEGLLVKVTGEVTRIEGQNIYVNDGTGEARVYIEGYIGSSINPGVADEWKERVKVGDKISAIGLASEDPEGHRLRVRDSAEIVVLEVDEDQDITDNEAVEEVIEQIIAIPEITEITLENRDMIRAARALYNSLTDEQKELVSQEFLDKLIQAEAKIAELEKLETPDVDVKPGEGAGDETGSENGTGSGSNSGIGSDNETNDGKGELPETGGVNSSYPVIFGLVLTGLGVLGLFKKKQKVNEKNN